MAVNLSGIRSEREVWLFFLIATLLFVYPIISADYLFYDDQWRALSLPDPAWLTQGRAWVDLLFRGLTFSHGTPNTFPLPLLLATLLVSFALTRLTLHYSHEPTLADCLVVLPLWYSPFFLGNLTYQYDGPSMALAIVAVIYAVVYPSPRLWKQVLIPGVLISFALGLYQASVSVFVGLCCVEWVRAVVDKQSFHLTLQSLALRIIQLLVAVLIYTLTCYPLYDSDRGVLLPLNAQWFAIVVARMSNAFGILGLLFTPGNTWFSIILLVAAGATFLFVGLYLLTARESAALKVLMAALYIAVIPVLLIAVPGIRLLFEDGAPDARNLMGFSTVLLFVFYLSNQLFKRVHRELGLFLVIPLFCMLSFAFAYGQVLIAKKELETSVVQDLAYDLVSNKALIGVKIFYLIGPGSNGNWIPGAHGAMTLMPALRYILSDMDQLVIAERLPRVGINNVAGWWAKKSFATSVANKEYVQVVDNKFYAIYVVDGEGYIVLTKITEPEAYTAQP